MLFGINGCFLAATTTSTNLRIRLTKVGNIIRTRFTNGGDSIRRAFVA